LKAIPSKEQQKTVDELTSIQAKQKKEVDERENRSFGRMSQEKVGKGSVTAGFSKGQIKGLKQ